MGETAVCFGADGEKPGETIGMDKKGKFKVHSNREFLPGDPD